MGRPEKAGPPLGDTTLYETDVFFRAVDFVIARSKGHCYVPF